MGIRAAIALALLVVGIAPAQADIFAFTDAAGVTHYSNVPVDGRYALLLRDPEPAPEAGTLGPAGTVQQRAAAMAPLIERAAREAAVQPALLRAVIAIESAFNPRAVSRAGAQGLMQLHPNTARRYGVAHPFDPAENLAGGARYLSDLIRRYDNNLELALAAYNAGEESVDRYGRRIPPFRETQHYVPAVLKLYRELLSRSARSPA